MSERLLDVSVDQLFPDPTQPRKTFRPDEIKRLADSIKARGVLTPLRVMPGKDGRSWAIICGESRWRAAREAGLLTVPCVVDERAPSEAELLADRIIENNCRTDLRPLEFARSLTKLKALRGLNSQQVAMELGLSSATITRAEALLSLPEDLQAMVDDGRLPESAGYELSRLDDEAAMRELAAAIISKRLNRDDLAGQVRARLAGRKGKKAKLARVTCKVDGVAISLSTGHRPMTWDNLLRAIEHLCQEAAALQASGKDVSALASRKKAI